MTKLPLPNNNKFPLAASSQLLFDFAKDLIKSEKLDNVSAKKLEAVLKQYRGLTEKKLDSFIAALTPKIRTTLKRAYNRYLSGGYIQNNPGIQAYRLKDLAPQFRKALDNSVVNSLSLIKTQNTQTMLKLESVFRNWAMVPSKQLRASLTDPKAIESHLKNEILNEKDLRYQTVKHLNFIMKDQSNKLNAAMQRITANELGAIGFIWRNSRDRRVVGDPGGLYPVANNPKMHGDHYHREGKLYLFRDTWAIKSGYIVPRAGAVYVDTLSDGEPGIPIGCRCLALSIFNLENIPNEYSGILTKKGQEFIDREF
jgi:hypothetical protein